MKLISVTKSDRENKKYKAIFERENGSRFTTHFGAKQNGKPMDDYTITKDKEQRARYRNRHRKDLESNDPTKPGYLSWFLLWGDSTSLKENIKNYKKKFNL